MKRKKGFTLVEIIVVVAILGLLFGLGIPSYRFIIGSVKERQYENKVSYALAKAEEWANDTGRNATNIAHLIEEGYMEPDNESGAYDNPIDDTSMLCYTIRVDYNDNQYESTLTEERYCAYEELEKQTSIIELVKYDSNGQVVPENDWTRSDILLRVQFKDEVLRNTYQNSVEEIVWRGNDNMDTIAIHGDFSSKNQYQVQAAKIMNTKYEVTMKLVYEGKTYIYKAYSQVKIDRQEPIIYQDDTTVEQQDEWKNSNKSTKVVTSDYDGSGIYGYFISNQSVSTCSANKTLYTSADKQVLDLSLAQGEYYACVMDNVGNISTPSKITVVKVDTSAPTISAPVASSASIKTNVPNSSFYSRLQVKIHISDNANGSGVDAIRYCITKGSDCEPNNKSQINSEGDIYVEFNESSSSPQKICAYGYDRAGNRSEKKCSVFYLDKTGPQVNNQDISITRSGNNYVVKFNATDPESGIYKYEIYRGTSSGNLSLIHTSNGGGSKSFPINNPNEVQKYYFRVDITNNAGIKVASQTKEFIYAKTMGEIAPLCAVDSYGYCTKPIYVSWFGKKFLLMKGIGTKSIFTFSLEQAKISLIDAACCDQNFCHFEHLYSEHSGIWGNGRYTMKTQMFNYFENAAKNKGGVGKYLNQETFVITKNGVEEGMGGGKIVPYGTQNVSAYFGIMSFDDVSNMLHLDFVWDSVPKYYSTRWEENYITTQISSAYTRCNEGEHYACNNNPSNIMASTAVWMKSEDKILSDDVPAVSGSNDVYMTDDKNTFMVVPFKSDLSFISGNGTINNPYVIKEG